MEPDRHSAVEAAGPETGLLLLGPPLIVRSGSPCAPGTRKAVALAAYLGIRGEPVAREQLATLLWPGSASDQARRSLRGELARLRSAFAGDAVGGSRLSIWLDTSAVQLDTAQFTDLLARGEDEQAAALYRGPLLEGLDLRDAESFEDWLRGERQLFEMAYLDALRRLIRTARENGDPRGVLRWALQAMRCQPLAEDLYVDAMGAAGELDDRAAVLAIHRRLTTVLRVELGIAPGAEASALALRASAAQAGRAAPGTATSRAASPMVGRETEQALLADAIRRAGAGAGTLVFVHGPAGSGKTRLLQTVVGNRRAVWCPAQRSVSTVAYYPIANGLRRYLSRWGVPPVDELWLREAGRVCPELGRATPNPSLGAPEDKVRLVEGLSVTLAGAAGRGGLLVFDDMQWADPDTVAVLEDMTRKLPHLPVVIVVVARDDDAPPTGVADALAAAASGGHLADIAVGDLSRAQIQQLIRCVRGGAVPLVPDDWLDEFAGMVHEVLGGNPFYALECARLALDTTRDPVGEPVMAVKFGVRDVLRTRLDALPTQLRQLAEAAATAGEPIVSVVLAQMLDIGPWELADQLDALVGKGVLTARRRGLAFAHDLVAEVIYESLPPARRLLLHERAAHALTVGNAMSLDEVSGQIAAHLEAAGQETSAIPHHERAAEAACRAHAHQTAIHHYQRLRVLVPADQRTAVLLRLGELLSYGAAEEAEVLYRDGLRSASRHGDGHAQARCYFALGVLLRRRSDLAGSLAALTEALRRFQAYGDTEGVERTLEALTYAYIQHGDLAAATSAASQAADIASDTGRLQNLGRATLSRGIAHFYGGEHERALDCFEVARTMAVDTADELAEAEALRYVSAVYGADGSCGTPLQAWAAADRSIEICVRLGHRMGLSRAADGAGGAYLLAGDWQSALDCYVGALHLTDTVGYVWGSDALVYRIGHTLLLGAENKRAARALAHAEALSRKLIAPYWLCRTFLAESELAIRESNHQEAAAHASSALDLARQLNHHEFIGKATALLDHAAQGTCAVTVRVATARAAPPGSESADRLPAVPKRLDVPVRGVAAVSDWLDDVVHRQLAALPERR